MKGGGEKEANYGPIFCKNKKNFVNLQTLRGCSRGGKASCGVRIVLWCNGSTAVFGSACPGSNPGKTTVGIA